MVGLLILVVSLALFLLSLPAAAQVEFDGVSMGLAGDLETGYNGSTSSSGGNSHGLGIGGTGNFQGSFYNPNFLSFSAQPYYNRSQANSDSGSIFNTGGYNGNVNLFTGSHFPGSISFNQVWDSTGVFGIPGQTGLTTKDSSRAFGIGWSELIPDMPSLTVSYTRGSAESSLLGSDAQSGISTNSFNIHSGYLFRGWNLGGGFAHLTSKTNSVGLLGDGDTEVTDTSTNTYSFSLGHKLPLDGGFGLGVSRSSYNSDLSGATTGTNTGTTDNAYGNMGVKVWRLPVTATASYTDNVYGAFEEQVLSQGGTLLFTDLSPTSRSLLVNVSTGYAILPHTYVNGYVNRQELWLGGSAYGLTQVGANIAANLGKFFKGLTVTVGMNDNANKQGNVGAGLVANANYLRNIGHWRFSANYNYNQSVQTLLAIYQISSMSYGAGVQRRFADGLSLNISGGGGRTAFEQVPGNGSHSWNVNSGISWHRTNLAGNYSQSAGTSVLTPTGLIGEQDPIISNGLVVFTGKSRGLNFGTSPVRNLTLAITFSKANSNTLTLGSADGVSSYNQTELYTGTLTYRLRKLNFNANVVQFRQGISAAGTAPSNVTTYFFGISRWFKAF